MNKMSKAMRIINAYFEKEQDMIDKIINNSFECVTIESLKRLMFVIFKHMKINPSSVNYMKSCEAYVIRLYFRETPLCMRLCYDEECTTYDEWSWLEIFTKYECFIYSTFFESELNWHGYSLVTTIGSNCKSLFGNSGISDYAAIYEPLICRLLIIMEDAVESVYLKRR